MNEIIYNTIKEKNSGITLDSITITITTAKTKSIRIEEID
jgi:hypothetical protein